MYFIFDALVKGCLVEKGALDIKASPIVGPAVGTQCNHFSPIVFPDLVYAGLRVAGLGNSSVRYEAGIFRNDAQPASAQKRERGRLSGTAGLNRARRSFRADRAHARHAFERPVIQRPVPCFGDAGFAQACRRLLAKEGKRGREFLRAAACVYRGSKRLFGKFFA